MNPKFVVRFFIAIGLLLMLSVGSAVAVFETDSEDDEPTGVKRKGVVHNIAEDRKVTRVTGGVYEPEGIDIYLRRHIDRLYSQIEALQKQNNQIRARVDEIYQLLSQK